MMERDDFSIEAIARWDEHAFYLLYDRYYKALTYYASKLTGVMDISEDLVQELFSEIYESRLHFDSVAHLNAYLYNSIHNAATDYVRHKSVELSYIQRETEKNHGYPLTEDGEEGLFWEEFYHELFMFVDRMPQRQREVFLMYMDGKKNSLACFARNGENPEEAGYGHAETKDVSQVICDVAQSLVRVSAVWQYSYHQGMESEDLKAFIVFFDHSIIFF